MPDSKKNAVDFYMSADQMSTMHIKSVGGKTLPDGKTVGGKMVLALDVKVKGVQAHMTDQKNYKVTLPFSRTWSRDSFLKSITAIANDAKAASDMRKYAQAIVAIMHEGTNQQKFLASEADLLKKNRTSTFTNVKTSVARATRQGVGRIGKALGGEGHPSRKEVEQMLAAIKKGDKATLSTVVALPTTSRMTDVTARLAKATSLPAVSSTTRAPALIPPVRSVSASAPAATAKKAPPTLPKSGVSGGLAVTAAAKKVAILPPKGTSTSERPRPSTTSK